MTAPQFHRNPDYLESVAVVLRLRELADRGLRDSPEAEELSDRSLDSWERLSPAERHRVNAPPTIVRIRIRASAS